VRDTLGNFYGTTVNGGVYDRGTVFKLDTTGMETVLYSFSGTDGAIPDTSLVRDTQGNLYGTTGNGGAYNLGTVFKVDATGNETVLHSFTGTGGDGANTFAGLVRDAPGNLYGTTAFGGDLSHCNGRGCGIVFKVDKTGKETVLYSFTGPDGALPTAGLVRDAQGSLYGATGEGGASNQGVVFRLDLTGKVTVLYSFTEMGGDGSLPAATLLQDAHGNLYGTTTWGGLGGISGHGTVFKLMPPPATMTTLTSSLNPSIYGQAVTFTAVVTSKAGTPPDGETVSFMTGQAVLGTGTLSGGSASFTTSTLKVGRTAVKAMYVGDSNFDSSTSTAVKQVVGKATKTALRLR
jgi:uncharacterized repeat protein (TIGR03803 family)